MRINPFAYFQIGLLSVTRRSRPVFLGSLLPPLLRDSSPSGLLPPLLRSCSAEKNHGETSHQWTFASDCGRMGESNVF